MSALSDRATSRDKTWIAGLDEAGRGSCFGPVICCAVVFHEEVSPDEIPGLDDSKRISARKREALFDVLSGKTWHSFGAASAAEVDCLNPRVATLLAMRRAVLRLPVPVGKLLVDGRDCPAGLGCPSEAVVGGDALVPEISAASILAKVFRDRLLKILAGRYPGYGLERHKGYGTAAHFEAIYRHGLTPLHRRSFLRKLDL